MERIYTNPKFSTTRSLIKCDSNSKSLFNIKGLDGGLRKAGYGKVSNASNPLVSIITVTLNGAKSLEKTIKSVLDLEYSNIEYIIIDGASKDGTIDILRKYDDVIDYWLSEPDNGIYDAMNKGWALANEDAFILYLGAGDKIILFPENVSKFDRSEIICGKVIMGTRKLFSSKANIRLLYRNMLHHQALLINKSIHPQPPFNTQYKVYADYDFNLRLYKMKNKFVQVENFLSFASSGGVSSVKFYPKEKVIIIKKNYGAFIAACANTYYTLNIIRKKINKLLLLPFSKIQRLWHK